MPPVSSSVAQAMDRENLRLRKLLAAREAQLRSLSEAYVNLQQLLTENKVRLPHGLNQ